MRFRFPRELWHELKPTPERSTATARISLSVLLVVVVMLTFRMPFLSIGPYLVFLLAQKDMLLTRAAGALGIFTAAISFLLFYGVAALAWDLAWLRVGLWALLFFAGFYLMRILREPAIALGPLVVLALLASFLDTVPDPNKVIAQTGWLWALLGLVISATFLVQWLLSPPLTREVLRLQLRRLYLALEGSVLAAAFRRNSTQWQLTALDDEELNDAKERAEKLALTGQLSKEQSSRCVALLQSAKEFASDLVSLSRAEGISLARGIRSARRTALRGTPWPQAQPDGPIVSRWNEHISAALFGPVEPIERRSLLREDWRSNPTYTDFALRAACATMTCYFFMTLADWDGIHTAMITCAVTALPAAEAREHKQRLRIIGALLGGMAGIGAVVFLIPLSDGLLTLLLILTLGTALAAWISLGSSRIAYAGWQFALAFFMTVLHDPHPTTKLDAIRDRWIGILLGIIIMQACFAGFHSIRASSSLPSAERNPA